MNFPVTIMVAVLCRGLKSTGATCTSDDDQKICVAPDAMRALMKINNRQDNNIKPAFYASLKVHPFTLKGIDDVVKFEDVRINRGQGYDPTTGYFTAPRKGLYQISCVILGLHGELLHFQLSKNNAAYIDGYIDKSEYQAETLSVLVEMKKGDRVFIKHRYTSSAQRIHGNHHSSFSGYFLHE